MTHIHKLNGLNSSSLPLTWKSAIWTGLSKDSYLCTMRHELSRFKGWDWFDGLGARITKEGQLSGAAIVSHWLSGCQSKSKGKIRRSKGILWAQEFKPSLGYIARLSSNNAKQQAQCNQNGRSTSTTHILWKHWYSGFSYTTSKCLIESHNI